VLQFLQPITADCPSPLHRQVSGRIDREHDALAGRKVHDTAIIIFSETIYDESHRILLCR